MIFKPIKEKEWLQSQMMPSLKELNLMDNLLDN